MKTEGCREWRHSLGAHALGQLPTEERAGLEAHLEGCAGCRAELESLTATARLLPLADPERFSRPTPQPSPRLGERIATTIGGEREATRRRRRRRFGLAFGGGVAAVAVAAALAIFILPGGGSAEPEQHVEFASLPAGVHIYATLQPRSYGTEIHMYVKGVRSGTLCRVLLRGPGGERVPAGTFRYRWGDDSDAVLSSALDLSQTRAIVVHAGNRTFSAPVDASGAAANPTEEDVT